MKNVFLKYKYYFLLLFVAFTWLLLLDFLLQLKHQTIIFPDATTYNEAATNLFYHLRGHCYRPILMAVISGFPLVFGASATDLYTISIFTNIVFWLCSILIVFSLIKKYTSNKVAFYLAVVYILFIGIGIYNFQLLAEIPYLLSLLLFLFFLKKYNDTLCFKWLSIALSILILSMLIKPGSKFIAIIVLGYYIIPLILNFKTKAMLLIYASVLMCLLQGFGLKHQFGNFTISYIDSVTFHNYLFSKADCYRNNVEYTQINNPRANYFFSLEVKQQKEVANKDIKEQLFNNKINIGKAYLHNLFWNSATGTIIIPLYDNKLNKSNFETIKSSLYVISKYQNRIMTVLGLFLSLLAIILYYKKDSFIVIISLLTLYIIGISGISSNQGDRFHLITYPFTLILIGCIYKSKEFKQFFEQLRIK